MGLFGLAAGCIPANTPKAPFADASNATPPINHGWFEAGLTWHGDFGDPDILRVGNTYYAYSSSAGGRYLSVLTSTDLKTWTIHQRWSTGFLVDNHVLVPPTTRATTGRRELPTRATADTARRCCFSTAIPERT